MGFVQKIPSQAFGELALINSHPRSATVCVASKPAYLMAIGFDAYDRTIRHAHQLEIHDRCAALRCVPDFAQASDDYLQICANVVKFENAPFGTILLRQGEATKSIFIVCRGAVDIYRRVCLPEPSGILNSSTRDISGALTAPTYKELQNAPEIRDYRKKIARFRTNQPKKTVLVRVGRKKPGEYFGEEWVLYDQKNAMLERLPGLEDHEVFSKPGIEAIEYPSLISARAVRVNEQSTDDLTSLKPTDESTGSACATFRNIDGKTKEVDTLTTQERSNTKPNMGAVELLTISIFDAQTRINKLIKLSDYHQWGTEVLQQLWEEEQKRHAWRKVRNNVLKDMGL